MGIAVQHSSHPSHDRRNEPKKGLRLIHHIVTHSNLLGFIVPTSQSQQRVLDSLEAQIDYLLRVPSFVPDSLGRSAEKLSSFARVIEELPSENFGMQDLLGWASNLHASLLPYHSPKRPRPV